MKLAWPDVPGIYVCENDEEVARRMAELNAEPVRFHHRVAPASPSKPRTEAPEESEPVAPDPAREPDEGP